MNAWWVEVVSVLLLVFGRGSCGAQDVYWEDTRVRVRMLLDIDSMHSLTSNVKQMCLLCCVCMVDTEQNRPGFWCSTPLFLHRSLAYPLCNLTNYRPSHCSIWSRVSFYILLTHPHIITENGKHTHMCGVPP